MWSFAEARTTCRSVWSTLRIPAGHREAGTREWPPHWSRFWSGQTWPLQDLPTHSRHKQTWGLFTQERGHYICINSNAFFLLIFFFLSPHPQKKALLILNSTLHWKLHPSSSHRNQPVWVLLARWWGGSGVSGPCGELSSCDNMTGLVISGRGKSGTICTRWRV